MQLFILFNFELVISFLRKVLYLSENRLLNYYQRTVKIKEQQLFSLENDEIIKKGQLFHHNDNMK